MASQAELHHSRAVPPIQQSPGEEPQEQQTDTQSITGHNIPASMSDSCHNQDDEIRPMIVGDVTMSIPDKKETPHVQTITEVTPEDAQASESPKRVSQRVGSQRSDESNDSRSKKRVLIRWSSSDDSQSGIYWYIPCAIMFLAFCGFFGALGHHLYNQHLDGQEVIDSQWPQRWGLALAFFIKMVLVGSVQLSFKQRAWVS